jgi:putative DNA primase/helicase
MLTILGGAPGCGKTTIALSLAATVTRGGTWPDGSQCRHSGDVLVWSGEDAQPVLAARLAASSADLSRVHFVDGVTGDSEDTGFDPGRDMPLLEAAMQRLPSAPKLLIVDPIVSAVAGDSHKSAEVRRALQPVVDLARRLGCAVVGITQFSKGTAGRDPVERITGSLAFAALARLVLVAAKVKPEPGDDESEPRRVLVRAKSNIGPDDGGFAYTLDRVEVAPDVEGQRVIWGGRLQGTAREVLADAEAEPDADDEGARDCAGWLRELLHDGPVSAREVKRCADEAGYAWRSVQRAMRPAGVDSRRTGFGKPAEWFLIASGTSRAAVAPIAPHTEAGANGATVPLNGATDDAEVL